MKTRQLLGLGFVLFCGAAVADELADADRFVAAKEYARALPIYAKLAASGNAVAQFHLGELYWYGEGTPADTAKADELFRKAADAGVADARQALQLTPQRAANQAKIDYYVKQYDGADVRLNKFNCVKPAIPVLSTTAEDIKKVTAGIDGWQNCYKGFVSNLTTLLPVGKAIPADLQNVMTDEEITAAVARLDKAYASAAGDAKVEADAMLAAQDAWRERTNSHVVSANAKTASDLALMRAQDEKVRAINRDKGVGFTSPGGAR
ncbi:sel1 repeat family protein [Duganella sp. FT134W]|uniref:Sel1 repeat family protein n=1 Tax=Duganella margarita TaxID=2692170 RepID=A0A7X4KIR3_9BURK|nr:sel1 repeat family protein [Duganella margarita]MYM75906.1 sel1 repeat family protein [Duganella margarita]